MSCISQQQPASAKFAEACGVSKVRVGSSPAPLFAAPTAVPCWTSFPA